MGLKLKIEYLRAIRVRYYRGIKSEKTKILDELCAVTGYNRKYAIRILAIKHIEGKKRSGRKKQYSAEAIRHLRILWSKMGQICSKKMVCALQTWLAYYEPDDFTDRTREELLSMSAATIDRYLKSYKAQIGRRKRSGTKSNKSLKNIIPLKDFDHKPSVPGHIEADTVAHCGDSLSGKFVWSLTLTDVATGWTENRAIFGKHSDDVLSAITNIQSALPFDILSFNTDNGTEFLNRNLILHFAQGDFSQKQEILFTRSRAYRKNDNCHVEQKNFTHVRELFGYERLDRAELVTAMNNIYRNYFNLLQNFFIPQLKLKNKVRIGAKYKRSYDRPQTPYERMLESTGLNMGQKEWLRRRFKELNPFELQEQLKREMSKFSELLRAIDSQEDEEIDEKQAA